MKRVSILFVCLICCLAKADVLNRQESSNQLKKVIYSGDASQLPQVVVGGHPYAVVPIPEINLTNMPSITVWVDPTVLYNDRPVGLMAADYDYLDNQNVILTNGICYLDWSGIFKNFKIIVVYEDTPATVNSSFKILSTTSSNQVVTLKWESVSGQLYGVDSSTNLLNWSPLASNLVATGSNYSFSTNATNPQKFFRAYRTP
jgi:hypothetical protein